MSIDRDALLADAQAAWSALNPQTATWTQALSVAAAVLAAAGNATP